jgi:glycosyltransferase involved in cell wall biosynthesis
MGIDAPTDVGAGTRGIRRILVLTTSYPSFEGDPSSVFIERLLLALARIGYELRVLAPSDGTFHGSRIVNGIETHRFGYFFPRSLERLTIGGGGVPENMSRSVLARLQLVPMMAMFTLKALVYAVRSDAIYANWIGAGLVGAVCKALTGRPLVVSFRGDDGYLARDRAVWGATCRFIGRMADMIAPVSAQLAEILIQVGVAADKVTAPRFGVDTEAFHPSANRTRDRGRFQLLFVGSLIPRKGVADLLEAVRGAEFSETRLTIVGEGYLEESLRRFIHTHGMEGRVTMRGTLTPEETAAVMRESDALCLPSYMEGRPNVVNEAMASGIAVVSTDVGGVPDMVIEEETALLFKPGDVTTLRAHLLRLAGDPELCRRMGEAGLERVRALGLSWDDAARDFDAIFRRIEGG